MGLTKTGCIINSNKTIVFAIGLLAGLFFYSGSYAQQSPVIEGSDIKPLTASGSVGFSANAYTASGIQNRRAPASVQTTANMNFSLFGLSSGLNLLYSTDQSRFRQNMNSLSFNASWKWLTIQSGDVSPNFSEYGINGATVRGGYIQLNPTNWDIELSAGQSMRRVEGSSQTEFRGSSFERWTMAGRLGYQLNSNNNFGISTHYSVDKRNTLENSAGLTPKENLTVTPDFEVALFEGAVNLASQFTVSAFTRDLNSPKIPLEGIGIPSSLSIIQPHTSSHINYAGQASASFSLNQFGLELGYERVQPGYISLGVGTIRDDEQQIRISPSLQLFGNRLSLQSSVALGRDNLMDTRFQTRRNTVIGTNAQFRLTDRININGNYNLLVNDFSSNFDTDTLSRPDVALDQEQKSHTVMLQPTLTFQKNEMTHNISLSGSYFLMNNNFKGGGTSVPDEFNSDTYSSSLAYSLMFPSGFSINTMGNFLMNNSENAQNKSLGANVGASYSFFEQRLNLSLNGGFNQNINEANQPGQNTSFMVKARQFMLNLTSNYRLTDKDSFSLTVRSRSNSVIQSANNSYSELEGSFNYQHRF